MPTAPLVKENFSLEDFVNSPPESTEWVDGELIEKQGMTLRHGEIQLRLGRCWQDFLIANSVSGKVYTDVPCRTKKQGRSPDVAYLTPELVAKYGSVATLPQSFPLCAEIVSPTDMAENVLLKAKEYLESEGEEVWLIYPESYWVMVMTAQKSLMFTVSDVVTSQKVLKGFTITVEELLA